MNKIKDIKQFIIKKIIFRGNSIFSLVISNGKDSHLDLNILGVEYLELGDILNGKICDWSVQILGFKHMSIAQKRGLQVSNYKTIWISVLKQNKKYELYGMINQYEIEEHSQKYNPISEDKYD